MNKEKMEQFLAELTALTHKYDLTIRGHGYECEGLMLEALSCDDDGRYVESKYLGAPYFDWVDE
jgi:hypothetical protein